MVRIIIDDSLKQELLSAEDGAELCDAAGNVVARVMAISHEIDPWSFFPELTEDEIERRCKSDEPGLTTEQVKDYLRKRM
mgnify:CR=1 FL=1